MELIGNALFAHRSVSEHDDWLWKVLHAEISHSWVRRHSRGSCIVWKGTPCWGTSSSLERRRPELLRSCCLSCWNIWLLSRNLLVRVLICLVFFWASRVCRSVIWLLRRRALSERLSLEVGRRPLGVLILVRKGRSLLRRISISWVKALVWVWRGTSHLGSLLTNSLKQVWSVRLDQIE